MRCSLCKFFSDVPYMESVQVHCLRRITGIKAHSLSCAVEVIS